MAFPRPLKSALWADLPIPRDHAQHIVTLTAFDYAACEYYPGITEESVRAHLDHHFGLSVRGMEEIRLEHVSGIGLIWKGSTPTSVLDIHAGLKSGTILPYSELIATRCRQSLHYKLDATQEAILVDALTAEGAFERAHRDSPFQEWEEPSQRAAVIRAICSSGCDKMVEYTSIGYAHILGYSRAHQRVYVITHDHDD